LAAKKIPSGSSFSKMSLTEAVENYLRRTNEMRTTGEIVEALEEGGIVHASANLAGRWAEGPRTLSPGMS
jgi:hypothetical protein